MESVYQKALEAHLGGKHCRYRYGETDVTTDTMHAEIKSWRNWKSGLGQLLYYNFASPRKDLRLYLFGEKPTIYDVDEIQTFLDKYDVSLYCLSSNDESLQVFDVTSKTTKSIAICNAKSTTTIEIPHLSVDLDENIKLAVTRALTVNEDIRIECVTEWLQCNKRVLMETLRNSYIQDIDYTVQKIPNPNRHRSRYSNNYKRVIITCDTFQKICMLSRGARADSMRRFLIERDHKVQQVS